ncbi:MAG TPA: hypothetical protein VNW90_18360 [Acetobacteraceae bacterium]|jgi:hypothetical protein|nr:hypothetical protein [Acetobacteraceae bacterium]
MSYLRSPVIRATVVISATVVIPGCAGMHHSADLVRDRLPRFFILFIYGVASHLFLLDVLGFVLLILTPFWDLIPQEFQALIRRWIGLPVKP